MLQVINQGYSNKLKRLMRKPKNRENNQLKSNKKNIQQFKIVNMNI